MYALFIVSSICPNCGQHKLFSVLLVKPQAEAIVLIDKFSAPAGEVPKSRTEVRDFMGRQEQEFESMATQCFLSGDIASAMHFTEEAFRLSIGNQLLNYN